MKRLLLCLAAVFALPIANAAMIVSVTNQDGAVGTSPNYALSTSWTSTVGYTGVTITANLMTFGGGATNVYLTTAVGSGVTVSSQIAATTLNLSGPAATVLLFSNLDLPAGTYYLTIKNDSGFDTMWSTGTTATTGEGVTSGASRYGAPAAGFAPSTPMAGSYTNHFIYNVSGTAVPESSALGLSISAAALLILRRRNR